jgi:hypothetical protein
MPIDFQSHRFTFFPDSGHAQTDHHTFNFPSRIRKAESMIRAFNIGFSSSEHPIFREEISTIPRIEGGDGHNVTVTIVFSLRDRSGFFDDLYDGQAHVVVVVDRE